MEQDNGGNNLRNESQPPESTALSEADGQTEGTSFTGMADPEDQVLEEEKGQEER